MSESREDQASEPKKKRALRSDAMLMTRKCRQLLKEKIDPNFKETWVDRVLISLFSIATKDDSSLSLQGIKIVNELVVGEAASSANTKHKSESPNNRAAAPPMSEEELDAEIAELEARLGSISAATPET